MKAKSDATSPLQKQLVFLGAFIVSMVMNACATTPHSSLPSPQGSVTKETPKLGNVQDSQQFQGITIRVMSLAANGNVITEPLQRHAPSFEAITGAKIQIITTPFKELYSAIKADAVNQTHLYDGIVFLPQWIADYVQLGYLEDLTQRVQTDKAIQWNDIAPFFREFSATYQNKIYTIPLDGDFHIVYYRIDILQKAALMPPKTWDDYLKIAQQFQGQDLNDDGTPDYGSCIPRDPLPNARMFWSIVSPFLQSQGTQQGSFFDPETMKPLVKNEAFAKALEIYKETAQYGSPNELNLKLEEARSLFLKGRCVLTMDWGDTGTLAINPATSKVINQVGAVVLPGSREVLDRATGKLVACNKTLCPYAIDGVNYAPFAAFGGWAGGINAASDPKTKAAAYAFLSYISQPAQSNLDVTIGKTGYNPYRISQFTNREVWQKAGMSFETASKYLGAIGVSLQNPNMVLDLRVPQNKRYQQDVLHRVLIDFLAGKISKDEAMQQIEEGWEQITNEISRDSQGAAYRGSLGIHSSP